jgi:predicted nuclease of predicted toxin-antitoxin system
VLLFDQNISFRIVKNLQDIFPGSKQVREVGLENAKDSQIWSFAKENSFCIVTFDADFYDLGIIKASSPKVIWPDLAIPVQKTLKKYSEEITN